MSKLKGEASVKRAVEDCLKYAQIPCFRMQSGKIKSEFGGWMQLCPKGTADLLASPKLPGYAVAVSPDGKYEPAYFLRQPVFLWIETKAPKGKPTAEQLQFADYVRNRGHYWLLVDDVNVLISWLKEHRAR